jgi:hypothetical protein
MSLNPLVAAFLLIPAVAGAHHSFVNFDRNQQREVTGTVTRFEWKNPHVYIHLAVAGNGGAREAWQIEAASPSIMRTREWSRDSLEVGDVIQVTFNPARMAGNREGWLLQARRGDRILSGVNPAASQSETAAVAKDLSGVWVPRLSPSPQNKLRLQPASLPLTPAGRQSLASFREASADNPASRCIAPTAPTVMIIPEIKQIQVSARQVVIRGEGFDATRTVHLNVNSHEGAKPSLQGHSIGRWEGGKLVVDTQRFTPNRVGNAIGVASGAGKHLVETFELLPDGKNLRYTFQLADPQFLQGTVTDEALYAYRPELGFNADGCDVENSARFTKGG